MGLKEFFGLSSKKLLSIIILLVLFSVYGFIPPLTNPTLCISKKCVVSIGFPLFYMIVEWGPGASPTPVFNFISLIIDVIVFYLILSVLFYAFRRKEKNVPDSDITGRSSSPTYEN